MTQDALSEKIGISLKHWGAFEREVLQEYPYRTISKLQTT